MHPDKPETALDLIKLAETKFPALIRSHIKIVLHEFASNSFPQTKSDLPTESETSHQPYQIEDTNQKIEHLKAQLAAERDEKEKLKKDLADAVSKL